MPEVKHEHGAGLVISVVDCLVVEGIVEEHAAVRLPLTRFTSYCQPAVVWYFETYNADKISFTCENAKFSTCILGL